jgi:hypothetical protein
MAYNVFATSKQNSVCFRVTNVNFEHKTINIFHFPIPWSRSRDLMQERGIGEQDINTSLLKGSLRHKLHVGDILIECSNVNLLTFSPQQKAFLIASGVTLGYEIVVPPGAIDFALKYNMPLTGVQNGVNTVFTTPQPFIYGAFDSNYFRPQVFHNGRLLYDTLDYVAARSNPGVSPYYDQIIFTSFAPTATSHLLITYSISLI